MTIKGRIEALVVKHGSLRAVSRVTGIDAAYLLRLRDSAKTNPSKATLRKLGLKQIITYEVTL